MSDYRYQHPEEYDVRSLFNLLPVPYIRQEGEGARRYRNDCGAALVAMFLGYYGFDVPTVDQLASETTLAQVDNGLTTLQLKILAQRHGLTLTLRNDFAFPLICERIDAGHPVGMLIRYQYIEDRQNKPDLGGHFVMVCGYDAKNVYLNDPDFWTPLEEKGHFLPVPTSQFLNAIRYAQPAYQGLTKAG